MPTPLEDQPITVVKVGGSLFDWPELPARLEAFLQQDETERQRVVLVAGGGPFADAVRTIGAVHGLGERECHRLALRAMDVSAVLLASLLSRSIVVEDFALAADAWQSGRRPILAPRRYMEDVDEHRDDALPSSWETTSDSIAARVADRLGASRLVVLKSSVAAAVDRMEAARLGLVDPIFPEASRRISRVDLVAFRQHRWRTSRLA